LKPFLRWLLLVPAVILAIVASWWVRDLGFAIAISKCPSELTRMMSVAPKQHFFDVLSVTDQFCGASWFPAANRALLIGEILLSGLAAGVLCFYLAPSSKRLTGALSSLLASGFTTAAYAWL